MLLFLRYMHTDAGTTPPNLATSLSIIVPAKECQGLTTTGRFFCKGSNPNFFRAQATQDVDNPICPAKSLSGNVPHK